MSTRFALFAITTATRFTTRFNTRGRFYLFYFRWMNSPICSVIIELSIDYHFSPSIKNLFTYIFSYWDSIPAIFCVFIKYNWCGIHLL